jgi:hypothetical protein
MCRVIALPTICVAILCSVPGLLAGEPTSHEVSHPCCACKVCKLVCEQKKLTVTCYGCKCKDICIPGRSEDGCKHCATCSGAAQAKCGECPPKCEFCWRDWFPCSCAEARTVHVLTKYQAEKKVPWYHWEVVDAAAINASCCERISDLHGDRAKRDDSNTSCRTIYKAAPEGVCIGEKLEVTAEERVKLASMFESETDSQPNSGRQHAQD